MPQNYLKTASKLLDFLWPPPPFGGFEAKKKCLETFGLVETPSPPFGKKTHIWATIFILKASLTLPLYGAELELRRQPDHPTTSHPLRPAPTRRQLSVRLLELVGIGRGMESMESMCSTFASPHYIQIHRSYCELCQLGRNRLALARRLLPK